MPLQVLVPLILVSVVLTEDSANITSISNSTSLNGSSIPPTNFSQSTTQNETNKEESGYQYIMKLEYTFREEKIPEFISAIIASGIEDAPVTISDIVSLTRIEEYGLTDTLQLLEMLRISPAEVFSVNNLEIILNNLKVPFVSFYAALNESLALPPAKISQIIKDLNIDSAKFTLAIVLGEYNVYDVLRNGSFNNNTIHLASETAGIGLEVIFESIKKVILNYLKRLDPKEFDHLLRDNSVDRDIILLLWGILGISVEDVYRVNNFRNLISEIVFNLNQKTSLGVVTKGNSLLMHVLDYEECQKIKDTIRVSARSFLNGNLSSEIRPVGRKVTRNVIEVMLIKPINPSVEITRKYNAAVFENCTYITHINNRLTFQEVGDVRNHADYIEMEKSNQTFFSPGSPLICKNQLYGMAADENWRTINFDSFYNYFNATTTKLPIHPTEKAVVANSANPLNINSLFPSIVVPIFVYYVNECCK